MLCSVKPALLLAVIVSPMAALSVSDPLPVQPLTVKVLPPAVSVRLAVVNPLSVKVGSPVTARDAVGQRRVCRHRVDQGVGRAGQRALPGPASDGEGVAARTAAVREVGGRDPAQAERHAVGGRQRRVGQGEAGALARRDDARRRVGERPAPGPAADRERLAGASWPRGWRS